LGADCHRDDEGRPLHYIAQMESLESRRAAEDALAEERERLNTTLRVIADAVITTDADRRITYMNAAAQSILSQALSEVEGKHFDAVVALTDPVSMAPCSDLIGQCMALAQIFHRDRASVLHRPDGSVCYVTISVSPVRAPGEHVTGTVIVMHDDTERYHREREWNDRARRDPLTGLANRFEFERRAKRAFELARLLNVPAAIVAIDLDRFKAVNDAAGHAAGDAVLRRVAGVLSSRVRRSDTPPAGRLFKRVY
jgi:PAS domain S-box-containing protein